MATFSGRATLQHAVFQQVQRAGAGPGPIAPDVLAGLSLQYRSALKEESLTLRQAGPSKAGEVDERQTTEAFWHLAELLLLQSPSPVGPPLLEWVLQHGSTDAVAELRAFHGPLQDAPAFWTVIKKFICAGRTVDALELLAPLLVKVELCIDEDEDADVEELEAETAVLATLRHVLAMRPNANRAQMGDFRQLFQEWQADCEQVYHVGGPVFRKYGVAQLETVVALLCGDERALASACPTWFELMGAYVAMCVPCVTLEELPALAAKAVQQKHPGVEVRSLSAMIDSDRLTNLDRLLLHVISGNVWDLIELGEMTLPLDFMVHLVDLLHHAGKMDPMHRSEGAGDREHFLLQHAESLAQKANQLGLAWAYLAQCSRKGVATACVLAERAPLATEEDGELLLSGLERTFGGASKADRALLEATAAGIRANLGQTQLALGQTASGIAHLLEAGQHKKVERVVTELMENFAESVLQGYRAPAATATGDATMTEAVDPVAASYAVRCVSQMVALGMVGLPSGTIKAEEALLCLHHFWQAHALIVSDPPQHTKAANAVLGLLDSGAPPPKAGAVLLLQCMPLLEACALDGAQTLRLMEKLETLALQSPSPLDGLRSDLLTDLREALVANATHAFVHN